MRAPIHVLPSEHSAFEHGRFLALTLCFGVLLRSLPAPASRTDALGMPPLAHKIRVAVIDVVFRLFLFRQCGWRASQPAPCVPPQLLARTRDLVTRDCLCGTP